MQILITVIIIIFTYFILSLRNGQKLENDKKERKKEE